MESGYGRDREYFDTESLKQLKGKEKACAEELVIERLRSGDISRAVDALLVLRPKCAGDMLRELLRNRNERNGEQVVILAHALRVITGTLEAAGLILKVLKDDPNHEARSLAADILREYPSDVALPPLFQALRDPDSAVRSCAVTSILVVFDLLKGPLDWSFRNINLQIASESLSDQDSGIKELYELIRSAGGNRAMGDETVG